MSEPYFKENIEVFKVYLNLVIRSSPFLNLSLYLHFPIAVGICARACTCIQANL
jgi:hypothetical protein